MVFLTTGCALYLPCKQLSTASFRMPTIVSADCGDDSNGFGIDAYPVFTQGMRYIGILPDTLPDTVYGPRYREYCVIPKSGGTIELHLDRSGSLCAQYGVNYLNWLNGGTRLSYPDSSDQIRVRRFGVYIYNPGPGYSGYWVWDAQAMLIYQIQVNDEWVDIDKYSAPCGSETNPNTLGPNETALYTFIERDGPDLVKSRVCMGAFCTEEFLSLTDLAKLHKVEPWWNRQR